METLPAVEVYDNEYIYKRFTIDMMAKGLEESTIMQYLRAVRKFLVTSGKNYRDAVGQDIIDYLALYQYKSHISNAYKSTIFKYLSSFFKWAYKKRHIEDDIMRDVDSIKVIQKKKVRLSDMEVEDIREIAATASEKAILEMMLSTGARVSKLLGHASTDVTIKYYLCDDIDSMQSKHEKAA